MNNLCKIYDPDAADAINAMYGSYVKGEDVEVTTASRLFAQSTFTKYTYQRFRRTERDTKKRILNGYASADHVRQHARGMGSI